MQVAKANGGANAKSRLFRVAPLTACPTSMDCAIPIKTTSITSARHTINTKIASRGPIHAARPANSFTSPPLQLPAIHIKKKITNPVPKPASANSNPSKMPLPACAGNTQTVRSCTPRQPPRIMLAKMPKASKESVNHLGKIKVRKSRYAAAANKPNRRNK